MTSRDIDLTPGSARLASADPGALRGDQPTQPGERRVTRFQVGNGTCCTSDASRLAGLPGSRDVQARVPVVVLDRRGYGLYRDQHGRGFVPASHYAVRLVTDIARIEQAKGPELELVVGVPGNEGEAYAEAARFLYSFGGRPAARLVTVAEQLLLPAAVLREELSVAGPSVSETVLFRDKVLMKQHLRAAGIRVPDFAAFSEAAAHALFRSYPALIVKPRLGVGAENIFVLRSAADLAAFSASHQGKAAELESEFEVEEYINGTMYHVDSVVRKGKVIAATAGRYLDDVASYKTVNLCWGVAVPDGPLLDEILDFNLRVISCYQEFTGVTHHEIFVTSQGCCHCEIAARAGGGGVSACFESRTGVNLREVAVQAQLHGSVPLSIDVAPHLTGWAVIHAGPGVLREPIKVPDQPWVVEARSFAEAGSLLQAPDSCSEGVAVVSVRGDTEGEVTSRLTEAVKATSIKVSADE